MLFDSGIRYYLRFFMKVIHLMYYLVADKL